MRKNLELLNQFKGRRCEISLNNHPLYVTYVYYSFNYESDEEYLTLKDETESESNTTIELNKIIEVKNLHANNIYNDVVDIKTNDFTLSITLLEEQQEYPRCFKCGKKIKTPEDSIWCISGSGNYGSYYDGESLNINVCDNCMYGFIGEIKESEVIIYE